MLTVAVAEFAIGLAILVVTFRIRGTIAVEFPNCMKGRAPCCTPLFSPEYEVYFGIKGGTIRISLPKLDLLKSNASFIRPLPASTF